MVASFAIAPASAKKVDICPSYGDWVYDGSAWTLTGQDDLGSKKYDINGDLNQLYVSAPSGYLISGYCIKAGTETINVMVNPPQASIVLSAANGKDISHFSLKFVKSPTGGGEWCSPGFWRNNAMKHGASAWPVPTATKYNNVVTSPTVAGDPTLLDVLLSPKTYGGAAFNAVGDYLSSESPHVDFDGTRTNNCPIDQHGNT